LTPPNPQILQVKVLQSEWRWAIAAGREESDNGPARGLSNPFAVVTAPPLTMTSLSISNRAFKSFARRQKDRGRERSRFSCLSRAGGRGVSILIVVLAAGFSGVIPSQGAGTSSGSGVVINTNGAILTNAHVVEHCTQITVRASSGDSATAGLIARDERNDLALLRSKLPFSFSTSFREGPVRAGEAVVVLGYPLAGLLATTANLTVGNISALAGLGDDSRYLQISAPVQPGNSGGPLLDGSGNLVGIVSAKLDASLVARFTGDIPQNVNFAIKAEVARTFLDSKGITYHTAPSSKQLSPADIGDVARPSTVQIQCQRSDQREAGNRTVVVTQGDRPRPSTQRAILYEENSDNPRRRYFGSAIWHTEFASPGGSPGLGVRAEITIPARQMSVTWVLQRTTDRSAPTSYLISIQFDLGANFPGGDIDSLSGLLMKQTEQVPGVPFAGVVSKITNGFFLVLPNVSKYDVLHNIQLLKDCPWIEIPIVYQNGERALLVLEKGPLGDRAFAEAFAAWRQ
jgi:S1-C subfamily serine protease